MFELLDDWRGRMQRPAADGRATPAAPSEGGSRMEPVETGPALEPLGSCPVCSEPRHLRTLPLAGATSRLTLMCDGCGTQTDI